VVAQEDRVGEVIEVLAVAVGLAGPGSGGQGRLQLAQERAQPAAQRAIETGRGIVGGERAW